MISLKRYLDSTTTTQVDLLGSIVDAYRSALTAMGISALQACPSAGEGLQRTLTSLGQEVSAATDPETIVSAEARVTQELQQWGDVAHTSLQQQAKDVKELLVVLSRTGATIVANDERHSKRFDEFTGRLQAISTLSDITQLRSSLVRTAAELKTCVEAMSQSAKESVTQLQAEVVTYQTRLEEAEQVGARDQLTGLWNRGKVVTQIERRIALDKTFSVAMIDLNGFKLINDQLGHVAGDDLLRQFGTELRDNARSTDLVGRWGGDEFVVVLDGALTEAELHIERIKKWISGTYTVKAGDGPHKVELEAAIGLAQWTPGQGINEIIDQADAAMYKKKRAPR